VFRRRNSATSEVEDQDQGAAGFTATDIDSDQSRPGMTPKKGAPTPKRSEAEAKRRQPYQAPTDRKAASKEARKRDAASRLRKSQALQRGEDWAMPPKDRGPVRALARDVVDARRSIGEYYMFMVIVLIVLLVLPGTQAKVIADFVVVGLLTVIVGEGWYVSTKVKKLAAERLPGQSTRGIRMYVIMRSISMRRMRMPKPRVNRGDRV